MGYCRALSRVSVVLLCGTLAPVAGATDVAVSSGGAASDTSLGDTPDALPGLLRIGVPGLEGPRASASLHGLYGYTEAQNGEDGAHHRIGASAAAAVAPWSFAALGVRADFRYDIHGSDTLGSDSGSVLDITPLLRFGTMLSSGFHVGAEGRLRLPGATGGESGLSPEVDARLLGAYSGLPSWVFAAYAGYRLGHQGSIVEDSANMRPGDRVSLGLSEFDAILWGLGVSKGIAKTEIFGEVTADTLIGSGAPSFGESPLRIGVGARHPIIERLWLSGAVEVTPMGRAPSLPGDPLVPIEPRVQAFVGLTWRFLAPKPPHEPEPVEEAQEKPIEEEPAPVEVAPVVVTSSVQVTVVDQTGHPISDAKVTVEVPKHGEEEARTLDVPLVETNSYRVEGLPVGAVEIVVQADLLKPHTQSVLIKEGSVAEVQVTLLPAATVGSQLRGLVRSYSGEGVAASVTVEPGGHTAKCDAEGVFELELPPGVYKVIIQAEGYRSQNRTLRVRTEGVTVLNADLQEAAP